MNEGWEEIRLDEISNVVMGLSPKGDTYNSEFIGMPLLNGPTEFGETYPSCTLFTTDPKRICKKGDLIFCVRGSTTGRMNWADKPYALGRGVCSITGIDNLTTKFIKQLLTLNLRGLLQITGGGTFPNLRKEDINGFKFKIPKNYRKIASILSAYDDLIENNLKRIKLLEEQAQLTYEEWFVRFKFPGHETTTFDEETGLPEGWEKGKIEDYFKTSSGGTPSRKKIKEYYTNGNINWVKTKELLGSFIFDTEEKITEKGLNNSSAKLFPANTILIGMYGGVHGEGRKSTLGQLGIITKPSTSNQACCAFLKKEGINYSVPYLFYYLKSKQKQLLNISMGAAQQNISQSMIKKFPFILPNKDVYDRFDEQVSLLFSSIIVLHKQNQLLKETRDMLLPRLMSGMIDVEKLEVGSLKYEVNDSLGMVAEDSKKYDEA